MYTRKQYMSKECSHAEYHAQFVDQNVINRVLRLIGIDSLLKSTDEYMNDIPLAKWDNVLSPFPRYIGDKMREAGDFPTQAGAVCIAKAAARKILEDY